MKENISNYRIDGTYAVRMYDKFDRQWFDVKTGLTLIAALTLWDKETYGGTRNTRYEDGQYFDIFPANKSIGFTHTF